MSCIVLYTCLRNSYLRLQRPGRHLRGNFHAVLSLTEGDSKGRTIRYVHIVDVRQLFWWAVILAFAVVQSPSHVWLSATPWTAARQASLSITTSHSLLKPMSSELVMPSNHLILCRPLLLSIFPSIKVFSNESVLRSWWPKHLLMGPYFVKWKSEFRV